MSRISRLLIVFILLGSFGCRQIEKKGCLRFFIDGVPSETELAADKNPTPKRSMAEIINEIKKTEAAKWQSKHSPWENGKCIVCHDEEGGAISALASGRIDTLCFKCHKKESFQKKNVNLPVFLGRCNICHEPHESREKKLMREPTVNICLICHSDFQDRTKFIKNKGSDLGSCITCHNVHASDEDHLLKAPEKEICMQCHKYDPEKKNPNMNLESMYKMPKCVMCHKKDAHAMHLEKGDTQVSQNEIVKDYARWRKHPPFEKPECKKCHNFSGDGSNILIEGGVTKVCLECHGPESIKPDNPKKDFLTAMYKMPLCISCHKAVIHGKK